MTGRKVILVLTMVMDLLVVRGVTACPQTPDTPEPTAEAKKSGKMQQDPKPKPDPAANDEDKDTSVKLSHNFRGLGERFLLDQKNIWVSPAKLRFTDLDG